jgi:hypothetical protein
LCFFALPFGLLAQNQELKYKSRQVLVQPEPLYILDGKVVDKVDLQKDSSQNIIFVSKFVKPSDIESISVQKGDEAIRKFGDAGKNGVIIFTTIAYSEESRKKQR